MGLIGTIPRHSLAFLLGLAAVSMLALLFVPPIPQPQAYHQFAEPALRSFGIPNFWDVISNLPFVLGGGDLA